MNEDSLYPRGKNSLVGFALCVVLGRVDYTRTRGSKFTYRLSFESEGQRHFLPNHDLKSYFHWKGRDRFSVQDHTFLWKYQLDFERIGSKLFHAQHFAFEIHQDYHHHLRFQNHYLSGFQSTVKVKECGICPLYTK
ncbi:hypothetical protein MtrunA17_Chr8g0382371 [Medicago truncatula]|nr:hypothetical protein MtrunA17_Chr8g0382371 [Medicago truncatula]